MADAALWHPSRFLADGDDMKNNGAAFGFPSEFPYEYGVSSPAGSTETETESSDGEEDFLAGLTQRLSQTSLQETRKKLSAVPVKPDDVTFSEISRKTRGLVGSPQSTLTGIGSWSVRSGVSGDGSPNGYSRVPSPSTTPFDQINDPWDVIYAAAGQVARLKINNNQVSGLLTHPRTNQSFNQVQQTQQCGSVWGRQAQAQTQTQVKHNWLVQNRAREFCQESVKCNRHVSLPQSAFPPLQVQQQNSRVQFGGSGSRVGVPGGSSVKKGCGGTGVFLPRHYEAPSESRKKTGCVPVLLPAKVVHALNLNMDDLNGTGQPRFSNAFATEYDAILARRNTLLMQQRLSVIRREETSNYEIRLPQEWTY